MDDRKAYQEIMKDSIDKINKFYKQYKFKNASEE